jgi:hypothetical protein
VFHAAVALSLLFALCAAWFSFHATRRAAAAQ